MKSLRRRLVAKLDAAFSTYIRLREKRRHGSCVFCAGPIECCFHFVTRSKYSVRWDFRNAVGSCHGCNYRYEFDPHFAIQWYIRKYGQDDYDQLVKDGNVIAKFTIADLRQNLECMRQDLGNL